MKFLCDNCKAKYQIADEKVAGKTVRMKCRKCGHQIEVRAAVTETSVSTSPPGAFEPPRPAAKGLATSLSAAKPRAPSAPQGQASALAGAFQRTVQESPQSQSFQQHSNSAAEISVTDEWYVAINGVPVGPVRISELRRKAASGAVTEDSLCWQEGLEEWRPVRSIPELAALVREAAQGNRPSLISPSPSDGRASSPPAPPRSPSQPNRPAVPQRNTEPPSPAPPAPPRPMAPSAPSRSNVVPLRVAASSSSSNLDPLDSPPVTSPLGGAAAALAPAFTPQPHNIFAPPQMQMHMQPAPAPAPPPPAPLAISDPFAVPFGPPGQGGGPPAPMMQAPSPLGPSTGSSSWLPPAPALYSGTAPSSPSIPPPATKRGVPLWFWPILLFTGVFGVSAAVFVFRQQSQPPPVVIVQPTATATGETKPEAPPTPADPATAAATPAPPTTGGGTGGGKVAAGPRGGGGAAQPKSGAPTGGGAGIDLGGLVPSGAGGPAPGAGGGGGGGAAGGGQGLDSSSVERVVASHRAGVKRTCWERAGAEQKGSVNVTVSAQVAPDGSVASTSSSGDDPVVAKCIESQVRTWRFNAPGATTTVNIPFKFVRQ